MILPIIKKGDPRLCISAKKVCQIREVEQVIRDLWDTLTAMRKIYPFKRGIGVAAPQIGYNCRINVVEFDGQKYTLINPIIIQRSHTTQIIREGCLSFFEYRGYVRRHCSIQVAALNRNHQPFTIAAEGDFSMLLQHELDHLDGVLYDAHLPPNQTLIRCSKMPRIP